MGIQLTIKIKKVQVLEAYMSANDHTRKIIKEIFGKHMSFPQHIVGVTNKSNIDGF